MLTLSFWGADGLMITPETLTSGMVGAKIAFQFSEDWEGLNKTAVFMAGNTIRAVSNVEDAAEIPADVLAAPGSRLYVGIYGESEDGTLVIPTICVAGPKIQYGADPLQAPAGEPPVTSYARLLAMIGDLTELKTEAKDSLVAALNEMFTNGSNGSSADTGGNSGSDSSQNATGGMSTNAVNLLIAILGECATYTDQSANIAALKEALLTSSGGDSGGDTGGEEVPTVTVTGLSAVFNGETAPAGTYASDLDITVTAEYSDGTTATVTDYTISGQVAMGENTFTIIYGGQSCTVTVVGVLAPDWSAYDYTATATAQSTGLTPFAEDKSFTMLIDLTTVGSEAISMATIFTVTGTTGFHVIKRASYDMEIYVGGTRLVNTAWGYEMVDGDRLLLALTHTAGNDDLTINARCVKASGEADLTYTKNSTVTGWVTDSAIMTGLSSGKADTFVFNGVEVYMNYVADADMIATWLARGDS